MNLYIFQDILNDYSTSVAVYAKDFKEVESLFREYDGENQTLMNDVQEFIEDEEYRVASVLDNEEPRLVVITKEMQKLLMYSSYLSQD